MPKTTSSPALLWTVRTLHSYTAFCLGSLGADAVDEVCAAFEILRAPKITIPTPSKLIPHKPRIRKPLLQNILQTPRSAYLPPLQNPRGTTQERARTDTQHVRPLSLSSLPLLLISMSPQKRQGLLIPARRRIRSGDEQDVQHARLDLRAGDVVRRPDLDARRQGELRRNKVFCCLRGRVRATARARAGAGLCRNVVYFHAWRQVRDVFGYHGQTAQVLSRHHKQDVYAGHVEELTLGRHKDPNLDHFGTAVCHLWIEAIPEWGTGFQQYVQYVLAWLSCLSTVRPPNAAVLCIAVRKPIGIANNQAERHWASGG
ncbi:hypothetical protein CCUS01_10086 [Colletotrichum cuscutae]|uniref:Uncharacterized protein n=1 Tax=Colletotrichum cuscutae TaxID=1209917 RepID=A0AAI9XQD7_9PEZI|nr:hypothetical protein CCUS01_10086 [Colletotrichum cuscutae]